MSSRLTRFTGIAAGTVASGALFLGGAAPAFADTTGTVNQSNSSNVSADTIASNGSIAVSKDNTVVAKVKQTNKAKVTVVTVTVKKK